MNMKEVWEQEKAQKICAFDIDGVISDYPKCWIQFANKKLKTKYKYLNDLKQGVSYWEYKKLKGEYRSSGYKRTLPIKRNISECINKFQKQGYKVILLTARPFRQYRNLYRDTLDWLEIHKIKPNGIIWEKEKHWAVLQQFPYLKFMVEDNAEIANQVAKLGYKVYLVDNEYNRQPTEKNVVRVKDASSIYYNEVIE